MTCFSQLTRYYAQLCFATTCLAPLVVLMLRLCLTVPWCAVPCRAMLCRVLQVAVKVLESDSVIRREAVTGLCLEALLGEKFR